MAIIGWMLFVTICISVGNVTGTNKTQAKDFWVGEAGRAEAIVSFGNLLQPSVEKILITSTDETLNKESALRESALMGACYLAGLSIGMYKKEDIAAFNTGNNIHQYYPDPGLMPVYAKYYELYQTLYPSIKQFYKQAANLNKTSY